MAVDEPQVHCTRGHQSITDKLPGGHHSINQEATTYKPRGGHTSMQQTCGGSQTMGSTLDPASNGGALIQHT